MKLHFISGLPRSGSTLLAALLRQNPNFHHEGMSSPLAQIVMRVQQATSRGSEGAVLIDEEQRQRMLCGLFATYYGISSKDQPTVYFDTNRAWCAKMPLIAELFPQSKVICMVRDVPWIMNSIEKLTLANPCELSGIFGFQPNSTVYNRVAGLAAGDGMVGFAINALREAYFGPFSDRLMLLDYEALVRRPRVALNYIYDFIGEPHYEHDFDNFEYEARDFDLSLGTPGLHKVSGPVAWRDQEPVLPPGLFNQFADDAFWRNQEYNIKGVPCVMFTPERKQPTLDSDAPTLESAAA